MSASLPVDAFSWPARGQALAAWLDLGVDALQELVGRHGSRPAPHSIAAMDALTITSSEPRHASAGPWFALLTLTGAGEMVRALAALYRSTEFRQLTRGYLPVARSLQEHIGRVVWLCEPGAIVWGPEETPAVEGSDEWEERRLRSLLLHEEWMKDCVSHLRMQANPDLSTAEAALAKAKAEVAAARSARPAPATICPTFTRFAEIAQETSERLYGSHGVHAPRMGYKRASETSHGGLYGLYGDKEIGLDGEYRFHQSNGDLDSVAAIAAAWWVTGVLCLSAMNGWDGDAALEPFTHTWSALYSL